MSSKARRGLYWGLNGFFCLWMGFTVYAQLTMPNVKEVFIHLGFNDTFRVALSIAKIFGIAALLLPVPRMLKQLTYACFAVNMAAATIAHLAAGDPMAAWIFPVMAGVSLFGAYWSWRKLPESHATVDSRVAAASL